MHRNNGDMPAKLYRMARRIFYITLFVLVADVLTVFFVGNVDFSSRYPTVDRYYNNPHGKIQSQLNADFRNRYEEELNPHTVGVNDSKDDNDNNSSGSGRMKSSAADGWRLVTPVTLLLNHVLGYPTQSPDMSDGNSMQFGYQIEPSITHLWGQYSPYYSVPSEIPDELPNTCKITFAQILSRHGARDPTLSKTMAYHAMIERVKIAAKSAGKKFEGKYAFIEDYEYKLGYDQLTLFGQRQMYMSGIKFYDRYVDLAREQCAGTGEGIFVRASDQERVVESAKNFTMGYLAASQADKGKPKDGETPTIAPILEISEADGMNNTLSHGLCTNFEQGKAEKKHQKKTNKFMATFIPAIQARLNRELPGGPNLTDFETVMFMDLCPFETVARNDGFPLAEFCSLFSTEEWRNYDYLRTIDKYYGHGDGNSLGPTQGVGFAMELLSRMTGDRSYADSDWTTVNHTLDDNPTTFPVGGKHRLFADFSHDNDMVSMYSALNLYKDTKPLSDHRAEDPRHNGGWSTSWMVPFGGRMYVEKMKCEGEDEEMVRVLVNDRVIPMSSCGADKMGRCKMSKWIKSLKFARNGGIWDKCWGPE